MANLIISNICDAACGYCFASAYMQSTHPRSGSCFMAVDEFKQILDYLDRSGINDVRLLGGEPTLHPNFGLFIELAQQRGKWITVFTHGAIPEAALQSLLSIPAERCKLVVNMSAIFRHSTSGQEKTSRRFQILEQLGERAMPGFNIQSPGFDLSSLLQVAAASGMRKVIRLGLALPGPGSSNDFLNPKQYRLTGNRIVQQAGLAAQSGFILDFDCGFVRCMFTESELDYLQMIGTETAFHCSPILDICADQKVLHCFSLSDRFFLTLTDEANSSALHRDFNQRTRAYRQAGVFSECAACQYKKRQECSGGCLSATLRRFQAADFKLEQPKHLFKA